MHLGCNELVNCCMARPQSIVVHIASMANTGTRMSLSHSWYLQWYSKICYFHGVLRSGYATMRNAQRNKSEDNLFELGVCTKTGPPIFLCGDVGFLEPPPPPHTHTHISPKKLKKKNFLLLVWVYPVLNSKAIPKLLLSHLLVHSSPKTN